MGKTKPSGYADVWRKALESAPEALPDAEPVEMTFDGMPCRVRPLNVAFYIESGRMPDYLTRAALYAQKGDNVGTVRALDSAQIEDLVEGQKFQRMLVCKALEEPRVVDAPPGAESEGAVSYMQLAERRPKFVDAVKLWILLGCPVPKKEGEAEGVSAEGLQNFPAGKRRARSTKTRRDRKADRRKPVATASRKPAGT